MTKVIQIKKEPDMKEIKILGLSLYKGIFKNQKKKYYVCFDYGKDESGKRKKQYKTFST